MDNLDLAWLIPTALQVIGLAIGLGVLGLVYERAMRNRKSIVNELDQGHAMGWLALAGGVFAVGMGFTRIVWEYKAVGVILALILIGLAWTFPTRANVESRKITKQRPIRIISSGLLLNSLLGLILVLVLAWGIHLSWHTIHLYRLVRSLPADTTQIQVDSIASRIEAAANDLGAIHQDLGPLFPIFNVLKGLPRVGPYFGQVEPWVKYADGLAQAGKEITLGLKPLIEKSPSGQTGLSLPERTSLVLQSGQAYFVLSTREIDLANQVRSRIRPELMPASVRPLFLKLDNKFNLLVAGAQILQVAPRLLGTGQAQSYLVLAQNRDELRATGGFISGIGLVTIQGGKISKFELGDSYQIDDFSKAYPKPPEPLKRFMLADYWVTRDANWSPDFPTAAQEAQTLYTLSTGVQTQGVIAFNQLVVKRILEVIGPVQVAGTNDPVTAENVEDYMRKAWAPAPDQGLSQEWWLHRKDFMQQLGAVILDKAMKSVDQNQLVNLAKAMVELLDQGQLLVYFNEPSTQAAFLTGGWDGSLHPGSSDYLYLVDSNVGFNKVDSVIQRSLGYQLDLSDFNHPTGEVTMTYQHTGSGDLACKQAISYGNGTYQDMQQRCYLDYWRLYLPGGSKLSSSNTQPVPGDELLNGVGWSGQVESISGEAGTQILAGLLMLSPTQSSQVVVSYDLPSSVVQQDGTHLYEYILHLQVQPGLTGLPFRIVVKLPNNSSPLNPADGWKLLGSQTWVWQGVLDKSTELRFSIETNPVP